MFASDTPFERSFNKFSERLDYVVKNNYDWAWKEIKDIQKNKIKKEYEKNFENKI